MQGCINALFKPSHQAKMNRRIQLTAVSADLRHLRPIGNVDITLFLASTQQLSLEITIHAVNVTLQSSCNTPYTTRQFYVRFSVFQSFVIA